MLDTGINSRRKDGLRGVRSEQVTVGLGGAHIVEQGVRLESFGNFCQYNCSISDLRRIMQLKQI
jgi:hypothetical protein